MPKERKQSKFGSYLSIIVLSAPAVLAGLFFYPAVSLAQEINPYYGYERAPVQSQLVGRVNDFSGAFTNSFPLVVPPGRNGLQPDLALFYNSQEHNNASIFGYGWSIGIPSIERANKKGSDKLYTENFFYSSLSGELEDISLSDGTHGTYGAKAEDGNFLKYQYNTNNSWAVTDKKGTTYTFGATAASRQDDPAESTRAFKWMLTEVRDANNNFIRYEYFKDAGQIYPSKIFYTGNGVADGIFEIEFLRELRSDNLKSYKTGFEVTTNHRISEIQAKIQGAWVRKYVLNYAAGDNEVRSVLNSITESGQDESLNVITLPANNFDYQAKTPNWTQEVGLGTPTPFITAFNEDNGVRIADVNGDGLADILRSVPTASSVYLHNGSSWTLDTNWSIPLPFIGINGVDYGTRLVDINGDAIPDLVRAESGSPYKIFIQEGTTWNDYSSLWSFPEPITLSGSSDAGTRLADVNGDGLVDVLRSTDTYTKVHLHNGSGWTEDASWSIPESFVKEPNSRDTGVRLADVNGDGLADILFHDGNIPSAKAYINNGAGWTEDLSWVPPVGFLDGNSKDAGARLDDANGDGLIDILLSSDSVAEVYLNSGEGWVLDTSWATPEPFINDNNIDVGTRLADLNGDGLVDVARNTGTIDRVYFAHPKNPDLLSHMDHSKGAKEDIAYKPSADLLNPDLPFIVQTVETVTKDDSLGHLSTTAHEHTGGEYWSAEIFDRKLAGFAEVVKTDPAGNKTKEFYHQGNTTNSSQGEFSDDVSKIGKVYRTEVTHSAGNKYAQTINKWENVDLGNQRDFVKLTQKIDFSYDGNASHRDAAETYAYNDANGNLTQKVSWGEVTGSDNGTFVDAGNDKLTTAISYASNGANVVGFPSQETTTNQAGSKVKETRNYYDGLALGSVDKGNLTKQEMWKSSTSYIDVEKTYNSFGLVTQEKDPLDNATTYAYDSFNLYPASVTNTKNQTTSFTYDYSVGKVKTTTDPNSRVFETVYDGFGRAVQEKVPDLITPSTLVTKSATAYTDTGMPRKVQTTHYLDATNSFDVLTYLDGFERKIQERKEAESSNTYAVKDFVYNALGLPEKESLPYFATGSAYTSPTTNANLYTSFTYDALKRVKTTSNALGATTNTYDDWKTTITDALGNSKDTTNDAYGQLVRVDEHEGANTYTTNYEYNGLGNLTELTDSAGNVRNFTYNGLGKRLTAQDLHAPADGTFGTWTYTYDNSGNLTQSLDPKSQTVNYTYDDINRVLTEDYTDQTGTEITYAYDTGTNGVGRLAFATTNDVITAYTYNAVGGVATETETINSIGYTTQYDYDWQGNTTQITYPDDTQVQYTYNTAGLLESIVGVVTNFDYAPTGKVSFKEYANGTETTNTYNADALYRLSNIKTIKPAGGQLGWASGLRTLFPLELDFAPIAYAQAPEDIVSRACSPGIASLLEGKNASERATAKVRQMAQCSYAGVYDSAKHGVRVEFGELNEIEADGKKGVEILARAWKEGKLVGFGADGSVEWERFRIFNPPILVEDSNGNIMREWVDERTGETKQIRLREDPVEAIRQTIAHNVTVVGKDGANIQQGKIGNTVTTIFPDADPESTSVDGEMGRAGVNEDFATIRAGTGTEARASTVLIGPVVFGSATFNQYQELRRAIHVFDTSPIPDTDNIDSATYSVYVAQKGNGLSGESSANSAMVAVGSTPASNTNLVPADYGQLQSIEFGRTGTQASLSIGVYADITLNASGIANISQTGVSKFGIRYGWDFDNTTAGITWAANGVQAISTRAADQAGTAEDPKLVIQHSSSTAAPTAPTALQTEGQTNPVDIADTTPEFSAMYNDPDAGDTATHFQIQVATVSDFSFIFWDSLKTLLPATTTEGTRTPEISYAGDPLATETTYYWRIKLWDDSDLEGAWSAETATFSLIAAPTVLQNITFTYDAVGNITQIVDASETNAAKTVAYTYDDLYRLLSATATGAANGQNYAQTYTYDSIGNLTNKSDIGAYLYQSTGYANPHAATSVNGVASTYDNSGNLTADGTRTYTWTYNNRIASIEPLGGTLGWSSGLLALAEIPAVAQARQELSADALPVQEKAKGVAWKRGVPEGTSYSLNVAESGAVTYSDGEGSISFTPSSIAWDNEQPKKAGQAAYSNPGQGKYQLANAFGQGVSVGVTAHGRGVRKDVVVDSLESLGAIPSNAEFLKIVFEVDTNFALPVGTIENVSPLSRYSYLQVPKAWDSSQTTAPEDLEKTNDEHVPEKHTPIPSRFFEQGGKTYFEKKVPIAWLKQATFPVYFDADITYGTFQQFYGAYVWSVEVEKLDTNKFVVCYTDNNDTVRDTYCKVGMVSGSAISFGSAVLVDGDIWGPTLGACAIGTNKFAVVYADDGLGDDGFVRIGTVSGSTITLGSAVEFSGNGNVENVACAGVDEDKLLISYDDYTASNTAKAVACTVSGATASCGAPEDFSATDYDAEQISVAKLDTNKAVTCFESYDLGGEWCVVTTVSGTDLTHGSVVMVSGAANNAGSSDIGVWSTNQFTIAWNEYDAGWKGKAKVATVSGTTITLGAEKIYNTASAYNTTATHHTLDKAVFGFSDGGSSWDGVSQYNTVDYGTRTLTTAAAKDTFCSGSCASEAGEAMDATLVDTDVMVICFDDAASATEGQCVVGTLPASSQNAAPAAPTALQTEGQTNPIDIADATPEFSAVYNDPDAGDTATHYQIQVATVSDFSFIFWDSLKTLLPAPATEGTRTADISYAGDPLATGATYYWRIKLWDDDDAEGAWSTETATFSLADPPDEVFFTYNHEGQRVSKSDGITTTVYPNRLYNTNGSKVVKHIFDAEGNTIATVETEAGVSKTYYNHPDHLTGSNVVSNEDGNLEQLLDYYPFGGIRLDEKTGTFDEQRKFTGHEFDEDTNLHYYVQRYYNQDVGRFTSQDPVFLEIGSKDFAKKLQGSAFDSKNVKNDQELIERYLASPQGLNSYSYSLNNPLIYRDENGEIPALAPLVVGGVIGGLGGFGAQYLEDVQQNISEGRTNIFAFRSSASEYALSTTTGAAAGVSTVFGLPGLAVAGAINIGGSILKDSVFESSIDYPGAAIEGITTVGVPLGVNKAFGKVVGRNISTFSKYLVQGAHTQRDVAVEALQTQVNSIASVVREIATTVAGLKTKQP